MRPASASLKLTRRRFSFWLGLGLFSLGEKLHAGGFDELAAAIMDGVEPDAPSSSSPEHWRVADNDKWWWYEREAYVNGRWSVTGITTPIDKSTGEPYTGRKGYLDESLVPPNMRLGYHPDDRQAAEETTRSADRRPDPTRRARHGRPPSKWLRSLNADELRIWLKTVDVPEAGVSGMTFWTHLTRDHSFDPKNIAGLTEDEQARLHGAAHFGY